MNRIPQSLRVMMPVWLSLATWSSAQVEVSFDVPSSSAAENLERAYIEVILDEPSTNTVSANFQVAGGTAASGSDYFLPAGTVTFAPGETSAVFKIVFVDDGLNEPDETVKIELTQAENAILGDITLHTFTIVDDEASGVKPTTNSTPEISFVTAQSTVMEDVATTKVYAVLSFPCASNVTVGCVLDGGSATHGNDYLATPGSLSIPAGETKAGLPIIIMDDNLCETNETIALRLTNAVNATLIAPQTHELTIADNDYPEIYFEKSTSTVVEADITVDILALLTKPSVQTVGFWLLTGGEASPVTDYATPDYFTFSPGATSTLVVVLIKDDKEYEPTERAVLTMTTPENATLGTNNEYTITILDNDEQLPEVSFPTRFSSGPEEQDTARFLVTLTPASTNTVRVHYSVDDTQSTATGKGVDYTLYDSILVFHPGETQKVFTGEVVDDTLNEADETIVVNLTNATHAKIGRINSHKYWILDNDEEFVALTIVRQDVRAQDGKTMEVIGPLSMSVNLRGLDVDDSGNLYLTDQGPYLRKTGEGRILMAPDSKIKTITLLGGLTMPADLELTPDQKGFVFSGPDGTLIRHYFGISIRISNYSGLAGGARVHVFTDVDEKVQKVSTDGYFHFLDVLGPQQTSTTVRVVIEANGKTKAFDDVPLGQKGVQGPPYGQAVVSLNF
jgi:hypothetical protein